MDSRLPEGFVAETGNSTANGNQIHVHGLSTAQGLAIAALAGVALGISIMALIYGGERDANLTARIEAAEKQALVARLRTEGFTRALIAKGIDPYPHLTGEDP